MAGMVLNNACTSTSDHVQHPWKGMSDQMYWCEGKGGQNETMETYTREETPEIYYDSDGRNEIPGLSRVSILRDEWWGQFIKAYMEYGDGAADELGLAGQWGDLYRKIKKLKPELWKGDRVLTRESARVVLLDIIGHAFLAVDMIDREMAGGH